MIKKQVREKLCMIFYSEFMYIYEVKIYFAFVIVNLIFLKNNTLS